MTSVIILRLVSIHELLGSPDSLYRKRTLKSDVEEFIVEEAEDLPRKNAITLKVHLALSEVKYKDAIGPAIRTHFCYRREQSQKKFKRVMQYGWRVLFIAIGLLAVIFMLTEIALLFKTESRLVLFIRESFIILGWVALWRPLDLLLYEWYPIKTKSNLYYRLEHSDVQIILSES